MPGFFPKPKPFPKRKQLGSLVRGRAVVALRPWDTLAYDDGIQDIILSEQITLLFWLMWFVRQDSDTYTKYRVKCIEMRVLSKPQYVGAILSQMIISRIQILSQANKYHVKVYTHAPMP